MTVESTTNKSGPYVATGASGTFTRSFLAFEAGHIRVYRIRAGVSVALTAGLTHTGLGRTSGTVRVAYGLAPGDRVLLIRAVPRLQRSAYGKQASVPANQVERDLDLLAMQIQDLSAEAAGAADLQASLLPLTEIILSSKDAAQAAAQRAAQLVAGAVLTGTTLVFASYLQAATATIPAQTSTVDAVVNGRRISWVRQDGGPCLGGGWVPAGDWSYEHFGGAPGANITAAFRALHNAINGQTLSLVTDAVYTLDISTAYISDRPFVLRSNGARFVTTGTATPTNDNGAWALTFRAPGIRGDNLHITFHDSGEGRNTQRGVWFQRGVMFDSITVLGASSAGHGGINSTDSALRIAPSGTVYETSWVSRIVVENWLNAVAIAQQTASVFGFLDLKGYRRGALLRDMTNSYVNGGHIRGKSPMATGEAGENSILVDATADYATDNLKINNVIGVDAAEHAFRIGSQFIIRGVTHTNCKAINAGSGTYDYATGSGDHGACGFKALGPTSRPNVFHEDIHYINCTSERSVIDRFDLASGYPRLNYAGFQIGKVRGGSLINPTVVPSSNVALANDFSCINGVEMTGCQDISVVNPTVRRPWGAGIMFYDAPDTSTAFWEQIINVRVTGGGVWLSGDGAAGRAGVQAIATSKDARRISVNGLVVYGSGLAFRAEMGSGKTFIGCSAAITSWNDSGFDFSAGSGAPLWAISGDGQFRGAVDANPASEGSTFRTFDGIGYLRVAQRWVRQPETRTITVPNNGVATLPLLQPAIVSITSSELFGMAFIKPTGGLLASKVSGSPTFATVSGSLTGSAGASGNLTVGGANGMLYVENRTGGARSITVSVPGG